MRYKFILLMFVIFWSVMVTRLYHVSIKSNFYYEGLAKENMERKQYIKPIRGEIFDSNGKLLAMNRIGFSLSIAPHLKLKGEPLDKAVTELMDAFPDLNKTVMLKVYKKHSSPYNHKFIKVVDFMNFADMMGVYPSLSLERNIKIEAETKRYYPYGRYAAHIVGYIGRANRKESEKDKIVNFVGKVGKTGLERYYNTELQGELGYEIDKVTATNKSVSVIEKVKPNDDKSIVLNIDIELQKMIHERFGKATGVAIVMRTNGEVLSAVSYPAYNPNLFVGGISTKNWKALQGDLNHPFTNKFIHGTYPPGSGIKMAMAMAFEKEKPGILDSAEHCSGFITIGKSSHRFRCWKHSGHGKVPVRKAIMQSCDVFLYKKSLKVGIDAMAKHLKSFGLGVKTGVDMPREYSGLIPTKAWKRKRFNKPWYLGETVIAAIGQGYDLVTPLQVARYTSLMATGNLVTPQMAKIVDSNKTAHKIVPYEFDQYIHEVRKGMYDVCNVPGGTAYRVLHDAPITVAGKTGTSQISTIPQSVKGGIKEELLSYFLKSHAWITTYAPYKDPEFVVTVLVEHGGHGGSASAPIVKDIYQWLYDKGYFKDHPLKGKVNVEVNSTSVASISSEVNNTVMIQTTLETEMVIKKEVIKENKAIRIKINQPDAPIDLF